MVLRLVVLIFLIFCSTGKADIIRSASIEIPAVFCPLISSPPRIDGKLDDKAWKTAQLIPVFPENTMMDEPAARTAVYLGYDQENLYLGYQCTEENMAGLVAKVKENGGPVWTDDSVEAILDGRSTGAGAFHLIFNSKGVFFGQTWNANIWKMWGQNRWENEFTGKLQISTRKGKDYWTVEVKLPFESPGKTPESGDIWRVNFARMRVAGNVHHLGAWYPTRYFPLIEKTGYLCFTDGPVVSVNIPHGQPLHFGKNELKGNIRTTGKGEFFIQAQIWNKEDFKTFISEKISFSGPGEKSISLPVDIPWCGKAVLSITLIDSTTRQVLYRLGGMSVEIPQRLVLDGLLPCYYNDEYEATVHVKFKMSEEELSEIQKNSVTYKRRDNFGYVLHMRLRQIAGVSGAKGEPLPAQFGFTEENQWISYFPAIAGIFGEKTYSGIFRIKDLPEGKYGLKIRLLNTTIQKVAKWEQGGHKEELDVVEELPEEIFYVIPPPSRKLEPIKEVTIGPEGEIRVNGKTFFPLGLYWMYKDYFSLCARQGFNLADPPECYTAEEYKKMLDKAKKDGVYVNLNLMANYGYDREGKFIPRALGIIKEVKEHPSIFVYMQPDEVLSWPGDVVLNKCIQFYEEGKKADPTRLFFADTTSGVCFNTPSNGLLSKYTKICDIIAPDVYNIGAVPVVCYYDIARNAFESVRKAGNKTLIFIPQANEWQGAGYRWPALEELRAQAYLVIMGGAKGIYWYKFKGLWNEVGLKDNPKAWAYMKKLNAELTALTEVLGAPAAPEGLAVTPPDGVKTWHRVLGKKHFVFVANVGEIRKELAIVLPGLKEGTVLNVHGEYREVTSESGKWKDLFAPLDARVYIFEE